MAPEPSTVIDSWAELHIICEDPELQEHKKDLCRRVRDYFELNIAIPAKPRVICIFDDNDYELLKQEHGDANRGIHWPIRGGGISFWPWYTHDIIARPNLETGEVVWPFASVIYLHGSTCATDIGLTLTFAHELQHFLQYAHMKPLWAANALLINLQSEEFKVWWDFPIEVDARITAKAVAEELFGKDAVNQYISDRIAAKVSTNDTDDWKFVKGLDVAVPYDLAASTKLLVLRHRKKLESVLEKARKDADFADLNLDCLS